MRIFISWSGPRSKKVADYLNDWLRKLPMPIEPWVSGAAIEPGTRWTKELSEALQGTNFGILCLTPENQGEPWICFEGGALSKTIEKTHVVPYLIGMQPSELRHPLQQFRAVEGNKQGTLKMIDGIHRATGDRSRTEKDILEAFEKWWPDLEHVIDDALSEVQTPEPKKADLDQIQASIERIGAMLESLSSRFSQFLQCPIPVVRAGDIPIRYPSALNPMIPRAQPTQQAVYSVPPLVASEPTDFSVDLVGDAPLISNFAEVVRSHFNLPILGGTSLSVVGDSGFLQFSLDNPPADIQEVLHRLAQEAGVKALSIIRNAV